ncbi:1,2-phenylacetyl-CoA epoxidase subunit PaaC [Actinomadura macrotermitis]|uniref:1,2-phenylacetyl-CoA epoxidase, subunit C n=1 Tax=Actinomadura macrotermitis TaxID=2585200 RepID=A0A7K0BV51_9ACTN|nr:1,2-phenylacetyl-CoA epoxidase subunit PaaC [Actinomadura macrotermitis]MQY05068.1 1,2-phenylacetyl-CoA epoxidase, subunit C [Actinomadura macrotermitis]
MPTENLFKALVREDDNGQWAFGTGFTDGLARVDRGVPEGVDRADLAEYCLMLGDDALIYAQRLSEWCSKAPEIEEDIALANIALDLLGHARVLLARVAEVREEGDEDALAYWRDAPQFRNVRLAELDLGPGPGGDFAATMARLLLFSSWRLAIFTRLAGSRDRLLAALAAKGAKEITYHRDHATQWVIRLGAGTSYSRARMTAGLDAVWPYAEELFAPHPVETRLAAQGVAVDPATVRTEVLGVLTEVLAHAELPPPAFVPDGEPHPGRDGEHTEELGPLLDEMQSLVRAMPGATW